MAEDSVAGFRFPAVCRKKVTAAFDGGLLTSDGGVLLLAQAERAMGIAGHLAGCIARDQSRVVHGVADITATGRPVAMLLRTGKTPSGGEIAGHVRRLHRRIEKHWPDTRVTLRGDGHYGRPEIMAWCGPTRCGSASKAKPPLGMLKYSKAVSNSARMVEIGVGRNPQSICDSCFVPITCGRDKRGPALDADPQQKPTLGSQSDRTVA